MDNKRYNNQKLELRRKQNLSIKLAEDVMRSRKRRCVDVSFVIDQALANPHARLSNEPLALRVREQWCQLAVKSRKRFGELLHHLADVSDLLEGAVNATRYVPAIGALVRYERVWVRAPEDWSPRTHNVRRQFASLARHVLAKYRVPDYFDSVWFERHAAPQKWFVHIGQGGNLRTATDLPVPLTKMMSHHAMAAPDGCSAMSAVRYGQARGVGVEEPQARALLGSQIGEHFRANANEEAFWLSVLQFFARHPMLDPHQVGPIIDYLHHQKFAAAEPVIENGTVVRVGPPQPGLSMKGRDAETLVGQVRQWHDRLARVKRHPQDLAWKSSGFVGFDRVEGEVGNQRRFVIYELLSSAELRAEGAAMKHCVATYTSSCAMGRSAIFSMQRDVGHGLERMITIEVNVKARQIVQARSRYNAAAEPLAVRVMNAWATQARLTFGKFALTRWA